MTAIIPETKTGLFYKNKLQRKNGYDHVEIIICWWNYFKEYNSVGNIKLARQAKYELHCIGTVWHVQFHFIWM